MLVSFYVALNSPTDFPVIAEKKRLTNSPTIFDAKIENFDVMAKATRRRSLVPRWYF